MARQPVERAFSSDLEGYVQAVAIVSAHSGREMLLLEAGQCDTVV
jgi:hypothetical protein